MEQLNHPHLIRMLESIDTPKRVHIVMEFAGGGNLCDFVKARGRLSETDARCVFTQLLSAVEFMHSKGIIHRDIKLENVLMSVNPHSSRQQQPAGCPSPDSNGVALGIASTGPVTSQPAAAAAASFRGAPSPFAAASAAAAHLEQQHSTGASVAAAAAAPPASLASGEVTVKLVDFGFSVHVRESGKRLKVFCGTPSYMAPEITQRQEYVGGPVDIWSLAVLLYACLCGSFPFTAKTYPELYKKIASAQVTFPDHVSHPCRDLLRRMMTADPAKRITLASAKLHPWTTAGRTSSAAAAYRGGGGGDALVHHDVSGAGGHPSSSRVGGADGRIGGGHNTVLSARGYGGILHSSVNPRGASPPLPEHSLLISDDPASDLVEAVLLRMVRLGFRRAAVVDAVISRKKNAASTTYYLTLARLGRSALLQPAPAALTAAPAYAVPTGKSSGATFGTADGGGGQRPSSAAAMVHGGRTATVFDCALRRPTAHAPPSQRQQPAEAMAPQQQQQQPRIGATPRPSTARSAVAAPVRGTVPPPPQSKQQQSTPISRGVAESAPLNGSLSRGEATAAALYTGSAAVAVMAGGGRHVERSRSAFPTSSSSPSSMSATSALAFGPRGTDGVAPLAAAAAAATEAVETAISAQKHIETPQIRPQTPRASGRRTGGVAEERSASPAAAAAASAGVQVQEKTATAAIGIAMSRPHSAKARHVEASETGATTGAVGASTASNRSPSINGAVRTHVQNPRIGAAGTSQAAPELPFPTSTMRVLPRAGLPIAAVRPSSSTSISYSTNAPSTTIAQGPLPSAGVARPPLRRYSAGASGLAAAAGSLARCSVATEDLGIQEDNGEEGDDGSDDSDEGASLTSVVALMTGRRGAGPSDTPRKGGGGNAAVPLPRTAQTASKLRIGARETHGAWAPIPQRRPADAPELCLRPTSAVGGAPTTTTTTRPGPETGRAPGEDPFHDSVGEPHGSSGSRYVPVGTVARTGAMTRKARPASAASLG